MESGSFWPKNLFEEKLTAPVVILREQARHLSKASGRSILGKVTTDRIDPGGWNRYDEDSDVAHVFQLQVPSLGEYTFDLLRIRHHPRSLYPVYVSFNLDEEDHELLCESEGEFRNTLRNILSSPATISVIRTLKAQTEDPEALPPRIAAPQEDEGSGSQGEDDDIPF